MSMKPAPEEMVAALDELEREVKAARNILEVKARSTVLSLTVGGKTVVHFVSGRTCDDAQLRAQLEKSVTAAGRRFEAATGKQVLGITLGGRLVVHYAPEVI